MTTKKEYPLINRDISWLSFNYRVLQEAKDASVPLLEQIKFMAIYSSNLDEFFRVRVGQFKNLVRLGKKTQKELDFEPRQVLRQILTIVNKQQDEFSRIFEKQVIPELKKHNLYLLRRLDLNEEQKLFVENYFTDNLLPFVQPVLLIPNMVRIFLNNAALYLTIIMKPKGQPGSKEQYAVVKIPSDHLPRFIKLPSHSNKHDIIMLDDIVRHNVTMLFPGYDILDTYSIKLTRDAELYIDDEYSGDLIEKIKTSLNKRNVGPASRLVYDREMPRSLLSFLKEMFELEPLDLLPEGRYHNNFDFFQFPGFDLKHLKYNPLPPLKYTKLENVNDFFTALNEEDHLLHFPYQSYESVIRFFEEAAKDPYVTHIKLVQYRVAKESRIMDSLIDAVEAGKNVSVFIEVKARFDEEANIEWGEKLQKAGVRVHYSFPGLKVHSKLALIRRIEHGEPKLYTYLSTGNFNEDTARVYSDFGFFSIDERLSKEVAAVFAYLETSKPPSLEFQHLLVGQFNFRDKLREFILKEIEHAKAGKQARIILKVNSLQDAEMIQLLYKASQSNVEVKLIIRGICCLVPGVKGISENIEAISIVDRFLEHARIFYFLNNGEERLYLSSADWMVRNLSYRVETSFPVYDSRLRNEIKNILNLQLNDNVKARILDAEFSNKYRKNNHYLVIRSQTETYYYLKRREETNLDI
jgi:polyphosphate kinase